MKAGADFMKKQELQHVFIIGCKGIPAHYGGFETFVDKLTEYHQNGRKIKISGEKYLNLDGHGMLG